MCEKCGHEEMVPSQLGHLEEPLLCGNQMCREKWTMKMVHNRSTFHNKQIVKMQVGQSSAPAFRQAAVAGPAQLMLSEISQDASNTRRTGSRKARETRP